MQTGTAAGQSRPGDGVAGGRPPVRFGRPRRCAGRCRGAPEGVGVPLQQPTGHVFGHLRSRHPNRIRTEQFRLYVGADSDQPRGSGGEARLHLYSRQGRRQRAGLRQDCSWSTEDRTGRHGVFAATGHSHSPLRQSPRNAAGGGFGVFRPRRIGENHHFGA